MYDVKHIRHALCRMVDIALKVHQRGLLLKHAVTPALGHGIDDVMHIFISLSDIHVIADAYHVRHEGNHVRSLPDGLSVGYLALFLIQILYLKAKEVAR